MGIFYSDTRPGPGVDPNAPRKKGIFLYLELLGRKFFPLIKANFMYCIVSIPFFLITLLFLAPMFSDLVFGSGLEAKLKIMTDLLIASLIFNFYGSGPAAAAYSYITRSFTREQPVWIVSDGFDKFKENFKQSMMLVVLDVVILFLMSVAIRFYASQSGMFFSIAYIFVLMIFFIYTISHIFIYQIMVTYECTFKDLIKNSVIFAMAKLPMCVLLFVITGVLCFLLFGSFGFLSILLYMTIGMSFIKYPLEFYGARVIEKNIEKTK